MSMGIKQQQRLDNNWKIAVFMNKSFQMSHVSDYKEVNDILASKLKYHISWDALMPVVKKLDRLSENLEVEYSAEYENLCNKLDNSVTTNYYIDEVYKVVIEFIDWYNKYKNK